MFLLFFIYFLYWFLVFSFGFFLFFILFFFFFIFFQKNCEQFSIHKHFCKFVKKIQFQEDFFEFVTIFKYMKIFWIEDFLNSWIFLEFTNIFLNWPRFWILLSFLTHEHFFEFTDNFLIPEHFCNSWTFFWIDKHFFQISKHFRVHDPRRHRSIPPSRWSLVSR